MRGARLSPHLPDEQILCCFHPLWIGWKNSGREQTHGPSRLTMRARKRAAKTCFSAESDGGNAWDETVTFQIFPMGRRVWPRRGSSLSASSSKR